MSGLSFETAVQKLEAHIRAENAKGNRVCTPTEFDVVLVGLMVLKTKETPVPNIKNRVAAVYKKIFGSYPFDLAPMRRSPIEHQMPPEECQALTQEDLAGILKRIQNAIFEEDFPLRGNEENFLRTCERFVTMKRDISPAQRKWLLDIHERLGEFEDNQEGEQP